VPSEDLPGPSLPLWWRWPGTSSPESSPPRIRSLIRWRVHSTSLVPPGRASQGTSARTIRPGRSQIDCCRRQMPLSVAGATHWPKARGAVNDLRASRAHRQPDAARSPGRNLAVAGQAICRLWPEPMRSLQRVPLAFLADFDNRRDGTGGRQNSISAIIGQWSDTARRGSGYVGGLGASERPYCSIETLNVSRTEDARVSETRMWSRPTGCGNQGLREPSAPPSAPW